MIAGSPPRVRGKEQTAVQMGVRLGITPAYAGKRPTAKGCSSGSRDYPSVCGEKTPDASSTTKSIGSPPRMRGKVAFRRILEFLHGITPAYAGKRPAAWAMAWRTGDHPRVCGEKFSTLFPPPKVAGSPPRMRGKAFPFRPGPFCARITPAYAGKSRNGYQRMANQQDHPRVCGEKQS